MTCTKCGGSGFLNSEQIPDYCACPRTTQDWLETEEGIMSDVQICDCCGDGYVWYGEPGRHYGPDDPAGPHGPYARNGGNCRCH